VRLSIPTLLIATVLVSVESQFVISAPPAVTGIDHVPVAVANLEAAAEHYRSLGFALKPGRPHDNGIRNQHVKFRDGTEIELITAPKAVDDLTATYRRHLEGGEGPAFLALFTPPASRIREALTTAGFAYSDRGLVSLADDGPLPYVFFGPRQKSPTDLPEHFQHRNTAESLIAVWLAGEDLMAERKLFSALGAQLRDENVNVPDPVRATVAHFKEGAVVLLPPSRQIVRGHRIVGMTVRVGDRHQAATVLGSRVWKRPGRQAASARVFLAPDQALGFWLEFR
jgi:hypothetical protein